MPALQRTASFQSKVQSSIWRESPGTRHGEPGGGANSGGAEKPGDVSCLDVQVVAMEWVDVGVPPVRKPWENDS